MLVTVIVLCVAALCIAHALASQTVVNITANVNTTVTCNSVSTSTLSFGTLGAGSIAFTTPADVSTTISCSDGAGCTLDLNDQGNTSTPGLWNATSSYLIQSPALNVTSSTSTITAGTEGYGIVATTTAAGAGGTLTLINRYNYSTSSAIIGALTTTTLPMASSTSAITVGREVLTYPEAAISANTLGGSYNDTLTYSCSGN